MWKLVIALLFGFSIATQAQKLNQQTGTDLSEDGFIPTNTNGWGVKGGVSFSKVYGAKDITPANHTGYLVGVFGKKTLSDKFAVQPELVYSSRGSGYMQKNGVQKKNCLRMEYLDVPVLLVFYLFDNVSIHLGPQASYLLGLRHNQQTAAQDGFYKVDYAACTGLEAKVYFLRLGARYNLGLRNLLNPSEASSNQVFNASSYNKENFKNANFQLYTSISF